ncbi:hypothetical protein DSECCO2_406180 [anaerobic digester metagenome]
MKNLGKLRNLGQIGGPKRLLGHSLQKVLLGFHPADILAAIARAVVIVAETNHLQGLCPGQVLHSGVEVNGQVLDRVVIIHVDGHVKIHAANGVHQGGKRFQADLHGVVHRDAQLLGKRGGHLIHAADVICGVELVVLAINLDLGVPGDVHPVDLSGPGIHRHQNVGVAAAVSVIHAGNQDRVKIGFAG